MVFEESEDIEMKVEGSKSEQTKVHLLQDPPIYNWTAHSVGSVIIVFRPF